LKSESNIFFEKFSSDFGTIRKIFKKTELDVAEIEKYI